MSPPKHATPPIDTLYFYDFFFLRTIIELSFKALRYEIPYRRYEICFFFLFLSFFFIYLFIYLFIFFFFSIHLTDVL